MKRGTVAWITATLSVFALALSAFPSPLLAQNIQVKSATPPAAPQGTINLNVAIGGNGFKKGARAIFGVKAGSGMLSSTTATDVIATSTSSTNPRVVVFSGPITGNRTASSFDYLPDSGLTGGWATYFDSGDMTGDGRAEVVVGAPNAVNSNSCNSSVGAAQLFLSNPSNPSQPALAVFQPPTVDPNFGGFGYSVGVVPYSSGNPSLLLVGENGRDLGGVTGAGQVYIYKKN